MRWSRDRRTAIAEGVRHRLLPGLLLAATAVLPAGAVEIERRIDLIDRDRMLTGRQDELVVPVIVPPLPLLERTELRLNFSNALAVLPDRSQLEVSLNGRPLAALPLHAAQGSVAATMDIPAESFVVGRNELRIAARQNHRLGCSGEAFGELWTKLHKDGSGLTLTAAADASMLDPERIGGVLGASLYDHEAFTIATAHRPGDPAALDQAARIVQAVALARGARPLPVDVLDLSLSGGVDLSAWNRLAGRNVALIGTVGELLGLLDPADMDELAGGRVLIRRLPADPAHLALIFTGNDAAAIDRAIADFVRTAQPAAAPPGEVTLASGTTRVTRLGFTTKEIVLGATRPVELSFSLPPTFYAGDGQKLELYLNFAYAAGLAATSALFVEVNGIDANMIRLDRPEGAIVENAKTNLTLGMFKPGLNTITLRPSLDPLDKAACASDVPMLSIFDDSRLELPEVAQLAHGGEIKSLTDQAFPYAQQASAMLFTDQDTRSLGAGLSLLGRLAQAHGAPLTDLRLAGGAEDRERHLIVVGPTGSLPAALATLVAPARPAVAGLDAGQPPADPGSTLADERSRWKERLKEGGDGQDEGVLGRVRSLLLGVARAQSKLVTPERSLEAQTSATDGGEAFLVEAASPWNERRVVTILTAEAPEDLEQGARRFIDAEVWQHLGGDRARWHASSNDVVSTRTHPPFPLAPPQPIIGQWRLVVLTWLAQNRWVWVALVLGMLALTSLVTSFVLSRRKS